MLHLPCGVRDISRGTTCYMAHSLQHQRTAAPCTLRQLQAQVTQPLLIQPPPLLLLLLLCLTCAG
jgi:hypothetical protein